MDYKFELAKSMSGAANISAEELCAMLELPPDSAMGDYALPCFKLAKSMRKAPALIAEELSKAAFPSFISKTEVKGGYLNFFIDKGYFAKPLLKP